MLTTRLESLRNKTFGALMVFVCGLSLGAHPELQTLAQSALYGTAGVLLILFED